MGRAPRPAVPRRRLGRRRRRARRRLGGAQLEARRPRHDPLQLGRRPGPVGPRRLDARRQPAHLGLRDELRRARRPDRRQGQPADAEAHPPDVGGGRRQRAVQLDQLPDARRPPRGAHEAGRHRARVGRDRRHRRLRRAVRAQRWRHADRRRVVARQGRAARTSSAARPSSTARRRTTGSGRTRRRRTSAEWRRFGKKCRELVGEDPDIVFEHPGRQTMGASIFAASAAAPSSRARRRRAT